jgi:hypothetical protein
VLILWTALMPHAELPPAEAARKLEAAVHDYYARGNGDNAVADPGADYMRRLRVLWSWLSPDSQHAEPQLKRMLLQGDRRSSVLSHLTSIFMMEQQVSDGSESTHRPCQCRHLLASCMRTLLQ